jgi:hypothetical protein
MTADTSPIPGTTRPVTRTDDGPAGAARQVADTVAGAAGEVTARIPDVAQNTRSAITEANRLVRSGSDQTLKLAAVAAIGFATGLLVGGAHRLLVIAALIPAAMISATLLERTEGNPPSAARLQGR